MSADDTTRGLYRKFKVERVDPEAQERHRDCDVMVLDLTDDPHARPALRAYAESCKYTHPELSRDLFAWLRRLDVSAEQQPEVRHVSPLNDLYAHTLAGVECQCGPRVESVSRADGSNGLVIVHKRVKQ